MRIGIMSGASPGSDGTLDGLVKRAHREDRNRARFRSQLEITHDFVGPEGCGLGDLGENDHGRGVALGRPEGALLLPASDCDPAALPGAPPRDAGRWIDLASGEAPPARLTGPTLVLPN